MRTFAIGLAVLVAVHAGGAAFAQSKCDSVITKAATKKVACKGNVQAKAQKSGTAPDPAKLAKCEDKFNKACTKAQAAGDCSAQTGSCAGIEAAADTCAAGLTLSSPYPACTGLRTALQRAGRHRVRQQRHRRL